jgi:hypothetical protein
LALLALGVGLFAWLHHSASEASNPITPSPKVIRPVPSPIQTVLALPVSPTAPKTPGMPKTVVAPLSDTSLKTTKTLEPKTTVSAIPGTTRTMPMPPADNRMSQMRQTFEQNGWSVYWIDSKNEATAWKNEGKTGYEIRLVPGARQATVLKTGGRNIILKTWTVDLASPPVLKGYHVYTNANTLIRAALVHNL